MNDYELEKFYSQLTEQEKEILFNGISLEASKVLLKMFPDSKLIQDTVFIKQH
jgi:hypothetical protein